MTRPAVTPSAAGAFLALATLLSALAGASLLAPGGPLDVIWRVKPKAHAELLAMGPLAGIGFLGLSVIMAAASVGCFARRRWGWGLAVVIFVVNGLADGARIAFGAPLEGAIGVTAAALIVWWLAQVRVRATFRRAR